MKKITFFLLFGLLSVFGNAQIGLSENFDGGLAPPAGWGFVGYFGTVVEVCDGFTMRDQLSDASLTGNLTTPNILGQSNGTVVTVSFDYKVVDWSAAVDATPPGWGELLVEYSTNDGADWTTAHIRNDDNHITSNTCANVEFTIPGDNVPSSSDFKLRFVGNWTAGNYYIYIDNVQVSQQVEGPAGCSTMITPANNSTGVSINIDLEWTAANNLPEGYGLTVGTTSGGTDIADTDTGLSTSYDFSTPLEYSTTYYVNITPYNQNGPAENCEEFIFTTGADPNAPVDCENGTPINVQYCYTDNETTTWNFSSSNGDPLNIFFNAGYMEACCDNILIYDASDDTDPGTLLYSGNGGGDLTGISEVAESGFLYVVITSDGSVNCESGAQTPINFDVSCVDTTALPNCNAILTNPVNGAIDVNENSDLTWTPASVLVTGYLVSVGTTSGGTDIADNVDVGDVLTYDPGTLPFETTIYVTITPYNNNGNAENCNEGSFTTRNDPNQILDCDNNESVTMTHCYDSNENENVVSFNFASNNGAPLFILFNEGQVENGWDELYVIDSDGVTNLNAATPYGNNGDLTGLSFTSTGSSLTVYVESDGIISCVSSGYIPWDFTVSCVDTTALPNCNSVLTSPFDGETDIDEDADLFWSQATVFVETYYLSIGTTPGGTDVLDNQDIGNVLTYDPGTLDYETTYYVTIVPWNTNGFAEDCAEYSFTTRPDPNQILDCDAGETINTTYCYNSNENESVNAFYFSSNNGAPLFIIFNSGEVENNWDELYIIDSDGTNLNAATPYGNGGDLTGLSYISMGDSLTVYVESDGSVSCVSSAGIDQWDFTVACVDTTALPNCDTSLTSPLNGDIDVDEDADLSWNQATVFVTGYLLSIGTTPGGTDILDNFDVGNVLTYDPGTLDYDTTFYVTIIPYNDNGNAEGCIEESFTTRADPNVIIDCESAEIINTVYCYDNNENESVNAFYFSNSTGFPLVISFNAGQVENNWDELYIIDSDGTNLNAASPYGNGGDLTGLSYISSGSSLTVYVESDGIIGCQSSGYIPWDFDVWCLTCMPQTVEFDIVGDCDSDPDNPQFTVNVDITSLGDATTLNISDDQGSLVQTTDTTGIIVMGPYDANSSVIVTVVNADDGNCFVESDSLGFVCPPDNDECSDAIAVPVNSDLSCDSIVTGLISGATTSTEAIPSCIASTSVDVWFQFVAGSTDHIIELSNIIGSSTDLEFAVYEGSCDTLTEIVCFNDDSGVINALTVGETYYIRVFTSQTIVDILTTFDICINTISAPVIGDVTTYTVPELVTDVLVNSPCAEVSNITWSTGVTNDPTLPNGIGYFYRTGEGFPFEDGVVLVAGDASDITGPNSEILSNGSWAGDDDLFNYINGLGIDPGLADYNDASILEFDFIPFGDVLSFDFIFASEEYGTFQCSYSDAFAFFLTDTSTGVTTNLALVPGTTDPISVITVRDDTYNAGCPSVNPEYFDTYYGATGVTPDAAPINFNGHTVPMTATSPVTPNNTYHIKLVIADRNDNLFDSAVFLKGGSFNLDSPELGEPYLEANGTAQCEGTSIVLDSGLDATEYDHTWYQNGEVILDETDHTYTVTEPGLYAVEVFIGSVECSTFDDIEIEFFSNPVINEPSPLLGCAENGTGIFDLTENEAEILGTQNPENFTITYYPSEQDAIDGTNEITDATAYNNTSVPQTIYAVVENNLTSCSSTTSFDIELYPELIVTQPNDLEEISCDISQAVMFDLFVQDSIVTGGQTELTVSYHESQSNADAGINALDSPYEGSNGQIIYVRVVDDVTGCYITTTFGLTVVEAPPIEVTITEIPLSDYCQGVILTANGEGIVSYEWTTTEGTQSIEVTENGIYGVSVANALGCSGYVEYEVTSISDSTPLSDYTIIANNRVFLHGNNLVQSGGVGVTGSNGQIKLHQGSHITGFAEAESIALNQGSTVGEEINEMADVELPEFIYNSQSNNNSSSVLIEAGQSMTLDEEVYDLIDIRHGATVIFTQSNVFANKIRTHDGAIIMFEECTNLYLNDLFILAKNSNLNPTAKRVSLYVDNNVHVESSCKVDALIYASGNHQIIAKGDNINTPDSEATSMRGLFIANRVHGIQNVYWNAGDLCEPCATVEDENLNRGLFEVVSWPNPSNDKFNLKVRTDDFVSQANVLVYDISGKLVHTAKLDPSGEISFGSELEGGMYLVKINQGNKTKMVRLVKY